MYKMAETIKIRNGKPGDIKELYEILNNTIELRGFSGGEAYSKTWLKEVISDRKRNIFLVAADKNKIAGFLIAHILPEKDIFLNDLFVKQDYRNKGIASLLVKDLEKISDKIKSKFSLGLVLTTNNKMQNLFQKFNYQKGHTFHYFYKESKL